MTLIDGSPERGYQMAVDLLKPEMPKDTFGAYVHTATFRSYEKGLFTIAAESDYAC